MQQPKLYAGLSLGWRSDVVRTLRVAVSKWSPDDVKQGAVAALCCASWRCRHQRIAVPAAAV